MFFLEKEFYKNTILYWNYFLANLKKLTFSKMRMEN